MNTHPTPVLISRYAAGDAIDDATVWAIEAHLESCAACRTVLTTAVDPAARQLLDRVADGIAAGIAAGPAPARRRRLRRAGVTARILPWLATAVALMLVAVLFESTFHSMPSLVLLIAPVAPLLPVAAAWSRRTDPAWELIASMPRTGLSLLLRRTFAVLMAVVPVLAAAGGVTGHSPVRWLLPCLAFTAGALALGGLVGVDRAALGLSVVWSVGVIAPSLAGQRLPVILEAGSWPGWAAATAGLVAVLLIRAGDHSRPGIGYGQPGIGRN
ncbi:zf-HC2 domain-containing protein [Micromonospora sp. NBC_01813]|uniref:zf-HC2 domain-containing protein n=1 Tax=Micromonospora sp. NBC_01813 TaxID=2975988 RepID=UPI002DD7CC3F|nr:zf-HC2 domain-containing protein [Micromonospora sp. NBC_01813]WSA11768.1 zf-HC2 domain-containing protein [Micromonospora sp. NBC_01813]